MHADELQIDERLVRGLLAEQFPEWAELPIEPARTRRRITGEVPQRQRSSSAAPLLRSSRA